MGPTFTVTDSHCHLDELGNPESVLTEADAAGVRRIVALSQDRASMAAVLELADRFPGQVLAGLGMHPCCVTDQCDDDVEACLSFVAEHVGEICQVGEIGLDHKWATTPELQRRQLEVLERYFDIAERHRKPVNLHSRRCERQTLEQAISFTRRTGLGAQMHWFTQSKKLVSICNDEGIYVSVGPSIIRDEQATGVATGIGDELLLLESDAPVPIGGSPGHPRRIGEVVAKLAAIRGIEPETMATLTEANLARFFGA